MHPYVHEAMCKHWEKVHGALFRRFGPILEVDDGVLYAYEKLERRLQLEPPFATDEACRAWLKKVAFRRTVDLLRKPGRRTTPLDTVDEVLAAGGAYDELGEPMFSKLMELFEHCMSRLKDEEHRQAIKRIYFEGRTHAEVAEALGIRVGASRQRTSSALDQVRDCMNLCLGETR
jgi:RNA polymerase sigma factor (sigma-70 family)